MTKPSKELVKEYLKESDLFPETMVKKKKQMIIVFDWKVLNYRELKRNVLYYKTVASAEFTWTLQLEKAKGLLFVALLVPNAVDKHVYFLVGDVGCSFKTAINKCKEISDGLYVTQFCDRIISDPANKYIIDDALMIQCRYENIPLKITMKCDKHIQLRFPSDIYNLTKDLKNLYRRQIHSDYTIRMQEKDFRVHKWVLRTRSKHFYKIFDSDDGVVRNGMVLKLPIDIVEKVLMFIYSGELAGNLDVRPLMDVFCLALTLQIPSLMIRCISVIEYYLNEENIVNIFRFAKKYRIAALENAVKQFLSSLPRDWLKTYAWKHIIAEVMHIEKNEVGIAIEKIPIV